MSDTIVDMPKVAQMLDSGWRVRIYKGAMGSYEIRAIHDQKKVMQRVRDSLVKAIVKNPHYATIYNNTSPEAAVEDYDFHDGWLMTDDFTPEQALTRMAYKVFGEIL